MGRHAEVETAQPLARAADAGFMVKPVRPLRIVRTNGTTLWLARCSDCTAEIRAELDQATSACSCGATVRIALDGVLWGETCADGVSAGEA